MIYFIQEAGNADAPIKIGFTSKDADVRVRELQTGYPAKLAVVATMRGSQAKESALHRKWAHLRLHGEWFKADEALLVYISEIKETEPPADIADVVPIRIVAGNHRWVENSGTTWICRNCGCIMYCCNCCTKGDRKYAQWSRKDRDWDDDVWKATAVSPACDSSRPVPEWIKNNGT